MTDPSEVIISWPIASFHGWGIRGLNYALSWPGTAVSASPELTGELGPDDPRSGILAERLKQSRNFQSQVLAAGGSEIVIDAPVLVALGNDCQELPVAYGKRLRGRPHVGCIVFEDTESVAANIERLKPYDAVVTASRWTCNFLIERGIPAKLCHEGVDPVLFNPEVRKSSADGRFRVFSGGKVEYRKGQDLVIEAFRLFAADHPEALLVAAWQSPFPMHGSDFVGKVPYGAPPGLHLGKPNFHAWVQRAGIAPEQFELVPVLPNWRMPEVYAGVDVALFPNRREGGTSFPTMEAVACGVPTGIRHCAGLTDLGDPSIGPVICFDYPDENALVREAARWLAADREHLSGVRHNPYWTWPRHCAEMAEIVRAL
jgi:glycosyltransferase involved in cell wall biosynthesis